ncbi:TPA: hypothetical protein ACSY38_10510 [Listeria monocytogenes]
MYILNQVQGSRAGGTAKATSDIDIGVRVSQQQKVLYYLIGVG